MNQQAKCPVCQGHLVTDGDHFRCEECSTDYEAQPVCDCCGDPVSVLKACGSVDYFCNHCNELKSKSSVKYRYMEVAHEVHRPGF